MALGDCVGVNVLVRCKFSFKVGRIMIKQTVIQLSFALMQINAMRKEQLCPTIKVLSIVHRLDTLAAVVEESTSTRGDTHKISAVLFKHVLPHLKPLPSAPDVQV